MIVWGGFGGNSGNLNTGGKYNPTTDSWVPTTTIGAPEARQLHTAVWTGTEMIVWGGTGTQLLEYGREIQSEHRQLGCHYHRQRRRGARQPHGSLDWQ